MNIINRHSAVLALALLPFGSGLSYAQEVTAESTVTVESSGRETSRSSSNPRLEEVIVSASYREQDVQDVVGGIQVFSGEALDKSGVAGTEDYLREVPSVSLQKSGVGKANIAIRGISNLNTLDIGYADGSPTTGIYLNDVAIQGSGVFPDLNIFDLQRIEVLKGPQGTLYGEGSMGGAIKMVTMAPNMNEVRLRTALSFSRTEETSDDNWDVKAALNLPLIEDELALRVVGSQSYNGGFVDYPGLGRNDANDADRKSLRAILAWNAADWLSLDYTFLYDYSYLDQLPVVDDGEEESLINTRTEDQYADTEFTVHSMTAHADLGFANLTSVSSWFNTDRDVQRRIPVLQSIADSALPIALGVETFPKAYTHVLTELESFSQELRLISAGDERVDWIVGAFFRDREQRFYQEKYEEFAPNDPAGVLNLLFGPQFLALSGVQEKGFGAEPFKQEAVYGELNYAIVPGSLELTGGLRWFKDEVSFFQDTVFYGAEAAIFATDPNNIDPENGEVTVYFSDSLATEDWLPKLSLAWTISDDHMIYATVSKGFRSGTPNLFAALKSGPPIVRPDFVLNQEIGAKTSWFDNRLIANIGFYKIDWTDFQGLLLGTATLGAVEGVPFAHLGTGGDAEVRGAEFSAVIQATESLALILGVGYNEGEVVHPDPESDVNKGSELPNKPKLTWSTTASYSRPLWSDVRGEVSFTYVYVDSQLTVFQSDEVPTGLVIDAYDLTKAMIGVEGPSWRLQLFGDNLFDDRIVVARSLPAPQSTMSTPRTLGVRFSYDY